MPTPKPLSPQAAALVVRVVSLQLDALITEYGAPVVCDALGNSLTAASATASGSHHHRRAGTYTAIAGALHDAAQAIARIGQP